MTVPHNYTYYIHDGASFRSKEGWPQALADELLVRGEWRPYLGDALEPVVFGRRVTLEVALTTSP